MVTEVKPPEETTWAVTAVTGASRVDEETEIGSKGLNSTSVPFPRARGALEKDGQGMGKVCKSPDPMLSF